MHGRVWWVCRDSDAGRTCCIRDYNLLAAQICISQIRHKRVLHRRITPLGVVGLSRSTVIAIVIERSLVRFWERRYFLVLPFHQKLLEMSFEVVFLARQLLR